MCGIAGIINYLDGIDQSSKYIKKMLDVIHHRGPDDTSYYIIENNHFGHTRLSIIDIDGGNQPIFNKDKTVSVVFNGEIYNYIELKQQFLSDYPFYTSSDTEVIVALYDKFGIDCVQYFNGQFAIALFDAKIQKTFLIRDRVGICPFYYHEYKNTVYYASEIKSQLTVMLFQQRILIPLNRDRMNSILHYLIIRWMLLYGVI